MFCTRIITYCCSLSQTLGALGVLLGTSSAPVSVSQQVGALVAVMCGLAAQRPLILVVEDAEHIDHSSQARAPPSSPPVCSSCVFGVVD